MVVQWATEQMVPPPCDQHTPLVFARFGQSGTLHLTEPPGGNLRKHRALGTAEVESRV